MVVTIGDLCRELRNYFQTDIYTGEYEIVDGILNLENVKDGQYFRVVGSIFNDGVYCYPPNTDLLTDESFDGAIWAMAVPKAVMALLDEINAYQETLEANAAILNSPYQSESFGGYSYTKASAGSNGEAGTDANTWQAHFKNRMNQWRKIREL